MNNNEARKDISKEGHGTAAFIFDMDGTLLESTTIDYQAWVRLFKDHDREFVCFEDYRKLLGVKSTEVIKQYLGFEGEKLDAALKKRLEYIKDILQEKGLKVVPHAEQFLQLVQKGGFRLALATGARLEKLEAVLGKTDLRKYFEAIITADDVERGKPEPDLFLEAAKRLNIHPSQAIVVEDAENGVASAKSAGMKCIAITTTTPAVHLQQADMIIDSYNDLDPVRIAAQLDRKGLRTDPGL